VAGDAQNGENAQPISHGICEECAEKMLSGTRAKAREFLDGLDEPVFLADGDGRVRAANRRACSLVGKEAGDVEDQLGGDVIECVNARLPGGCGRTVHCEACAIRNAVSETIATGRPLTNVPASKDIRTDRGVVQKRLFISTERAGTLVLLRIEEDLAANLMGQA
jgi:PAS domain-containing protein